ncbi:MAG: MobV family relaxase [Acinetobacter baumannii]
MAFAILRTVKLKSFGEIGGSLSHNYRTRFTPNADRTRTIRNEHDLSSSDQAMEAIKERLPEKLRKNGVLCIEHLITASPDWSGWNTDQERNFFDMSVDWLKKRYGSENVITTSIHRDETTPHLVAYVVPLDDTGRLNARRWLGGRKLLSEMQTDFAHQVKDLGLQRGLEGSRAEHKTIKEFYAEIQQPVPKDGVKRYSISKFDGELPVPKIFEKNETYAKRVIDVVYEDVNAKVKKITEYYLDYIHEINHNFKQFKRFEMQKNEADKAARQKAERAASRFQKLANEAEIKRFNQVIMSAELTYSKIEEVKNRYEVYQRFEQHFYEDAVNLKKQIEAKLYRHPYFSNIREKEWALIELKRELEDIRKNGPKELQYNELSHEQDLKPYSEREQDLMYQIERERELWSRKESEQELRHKNELERVKERVREREQQLSQQREQQRVREYEQQLRHQGELQSYSKNNDIEFDM